MALIHERLYRSEGFDDIDFSGYIRELAEHLFHSYVMDSSRVELKLELEPTLLGIDQAIPCGLLLNECITNAFKHAFSPGVPGALSIQLREENGHVILSVSDDGKGMPNGFETEPPTSLGFEIMRTLTEQLEGTLEVREESGSEFIFRFPLQGKSAVQQQRRRKENGNSQHLSV